VKWLKVIGINPFELISYLLSCLDTGKKRVRFAASQPPPTRRPPQTSTSSQPPMAVDANISGHQWGSQPTSSSGRTHALDVFNALSGFPKTSPLPLPGALAASEPKSGSLPPLRQAKDFFDPPAIHGPQPEDAPKLLHAADFFNSTREPPKLLRSEGVFWAGIYDTQGDRIGDMYSFPKDLVESRGFHCEPPPSLPTPSPPTPSPPPSPHVLPMATASTTLPKIRLPARATAIRATRSQPAMPSTTAVSHSRPTIRLRSGRVKSKTVDTIIKPLTDVDIDLTMETLSISSSQPPAKKPARNSDVDIDMTMESDAPSSPRLTTKTPVTRPMPPTNVDIDMTDSTSHPIAVAPTPSVTNAPHLRVTPAEDEVNFVFNSNDLLATRQTIRSWRGSNRPEDWIVAREDLHAAHVDSDRALPSEMQDPWFPSFVSRFYYFLSLLTSSCHAGHFSR
jgi:hypothetical protein